MYHPKGFTDSDKFVLKGQFFYYNYHGDSYLNKFMGGLSLEDKFKNDDIYNYYREVYLSFNKKHDTCIVSNHASKKSYDDSLYDYEYKMKKEIKKIKNKTQSQKKIKKKCIKKNKIRQNGYDDKHYFINQQIIKPLEQLDEKELEIEEHYLFNFELNREISTESDYEYDLQKELDIQEECAMEWFRDNCY